MIGAWVSGAIKWRCCEKCSQQSPGFRGRRYLRRDGADMHHDVWLQFEEWHDRVNKEMWDDFVGVQGHKDAHGPGVPGL